MSLAPAPPAPAEIPIVDLGPLLDGSNPQAVARELHRANREIGFCYLRNHGVPESALAAGRTAALDFFRRPFAEKERVKVNPQHRGFLSVGGVRLGDDLPTDLKESFVWGIDVDRVDHSLRGPNLWPEAPPEFRPSSEAWYVPMHKLVQKLLEGFALALGMKADFFLQGYERPLTRCSYVYYPPDAESQIKKGRFGAGPHTDFGVLTVLEQDDVGGLEVKGRDGAWVSAPPIAGTLIVNVGDLLERWTNNLYVSTPHRVINRSGRERLSLVFAYDPDAPTLIDAAPFCRDGETPRQPPATCGDLLIRRFDRAFGHRQNN